MIKKLNSLNTAIFAITNFLSYSKQIPLPQSRALRSFCEICRFYFLLYDFDVILNDDEVTVVAEVIGGLKPAFDYVKSALKAGKSVVTSNKEMVAAKGAEAPDQPFFQGSPCFCRTPLPCPSRLPHIPERQFLP